MTALVCVLAAAAVAGPPPTAALRQAVEDLSRTFPERYTGWREKLEALEAKVAAGGAPAGHLEREVAAFGREALLANPLVSGQPLLLIVRRQYARDHHNTETMFQTGEINTGSFRHSAGGSMKVLDVRSGKAVTIVAAPEGTVRDPEVDFDGRRIVFAMRKNIRDDYHIYEVGADGTGLRQLTFGGGLSDIDPLYLPDGRIAFTSTREPKFCACNRHIMGNLYVMAADGANPTQIGHSTLHEGHGALTPDGRILYDRWEYVDRNFGDAQGLWTCNPDGTNHAVYWGNNTASPGGVLDARVIPGTQGDRVIAILGSCHDRPWGALGIIDRRIGIDGREPIVHTWPAGAQRFAHANGTGRWDAYMGVGLKYEDPWPLAAPDGRGAGRYFLAAKQTGRGEQTAIVLLDVFGNETVVYSEEPGCFDPMPLSAKPRPPVVPDRVDLAKAAGTFYVYDVYRGTGMDKVKRGAVKSLRIVESPEKRHWTVPVWGGQGAEAPAVNFHDLGTKRILGAVPVEADGSAHFTVPADRFVFFQLIDEQGMMIQSMRSGTIVRPGERQGCIGCHDDRTSTVPNRPAAAVRRAPSTPAAWYGPERAFSYLLEVQPVLDRHCTSCHDYGKPAGGRLNLSGGQGYVFNVSYLELWRKRMVGSIGAGPAEVQMPYSWGSHKSPLIAALKDKNHAGVRLDKESLDRLVTWVDLNGPYYSEFASSYRDNKFGRSPLTDAEIGRLARLTGSGAWPDFGQPVRSPCLAGLKDPNDPRYKEALALIRTGSQRLKDRPDAGMPGFRFLGEEARRQGIYDDRLRIEAACRAAILNGGKFYPFRPQ